MKANKVIADYWKKATPMSFTPEGYTYEEKRYFRYALQDYMKDVFNFESFTGKSVLDIGCGSGIDSLEFARNGARVTAVDLTENAVNLTKKLFKEAGYPGKVFQADARALGLSGESFDCVYSYGVLHHIPEINEALMEIRRVLKPGGQVMAMLYHRDSLLYGYSIAYLRGIRGNGLAKLSEQQLTAMYSERFEGCPYTKAYTKDEARELFQQYFKNVEVSVHYPVIDLPAKRKVKLKIEGPYELGWHLVVKGIK